MSDVPSERVLALRHQLREKTAALLRKSLAATIPPKHLEGSIFVLLNRPVETRMPAQPPAEQIKFYQGAPENEIKAQAWLDVHAARLSTTLSSPSNIAGERNTVQEWEVLEGLKARTNGAYATIRAFLIQSWALRLVPKQDREDAVSDYFASPEFRSCLEKYDPFVGCSLRSYLARSFTWVLSRRNREQLSKRAFEKDLLRLADRSVDSGRAESDESELRALIEAARDARRTHMEIEILSVEIVNGLPVPVKKYSDRVHDAHIEPVRKYLAQEGKGENVEEHRDQRKLEEAADMLNISKGELRRGLTRAYLAMRPYLEERM